MSVFNRLGNLIREDLAAIVPGSEVPLNRETGMRLLLYVAFLLFALALFLPGFFTPTRTIAPPLQRSPDESEMAPKIEEFPEVRDPEQI
jgi:hypothetical protein